MQWSSNWINHFQYEQLKMLEYVLDINYNNNLCPLVGGMVTMFMVMGTYNRTVKLKLSFYCLSIQFWKTLARTKIFVIYGCLFTFSIGISELIVNKICLIAGQFYSWEKKIFSTGFEDVMLKRYALLLRKSLCKKTYASFWSDMQLLDLPNDEGGAV